MSTAADLAGTSINARSIVTLVVFFVVNALVIFPVRIPLPLVVGRVGRRLLVAARLMPSADRAQASSPAAATAVDESAGPEAATGPPAPAAALHPGGEKAIGDATADGRPSEARWYFALDLATAPVVGVLLLLASTCIPGSVVRTGIVGNGGLRPYDIMTLFISFAYISVSLDATGLFRYVAFVVASRAASSGRALYAAFYAFFALTGLIIGNDPIVLSGTPFLAYFTWHAAVDPPTAFLFSQFQAANLVSALLVSSNPTNLVLTSAFGLSFLRFSAWTALPTVAAAAALYPALRYGVFRHPRYIPNTLKRTDVDPRRAFKDPAGGYFGATLFIVTIAVLVGLSAGGLLEGTEGVWTVTAPAAAVVFIRDCLHDLHAAKSQQRRDLATAQLQAVEAGSASAMPVTKENQSGVGTETAMQRPPAPATTAKEGVSDGEALQADRSSPSSVDPPDTPSAATGGTGDTLLDPLARRFPTATHVVNHLPLPLLPFAFAMFTLVEALVHTGWVRVWGSWWAAWARAGGTAGCVWLMGVLSVIGCNVFGTNIGATVLLSRVLQEWQAREPAVSDRSLYGSVFALAIGSNFGAYSFVFSASLAGLLWRDILAQRRIVISPLAFARHNAVALLVTMVVGCLVVAAEVCVIY